MIDDVIARKNLLRRQMHDTIASLGDLEAASEALCHRLIRLPELAVSGVVSGYAATQREVNIDAALTSLLATGTVVCLPAVNGSHLALRAVTDLGDLLPGWQDVREPHAGAPTLRPAAVDVLLVPGLAFDATGNRLGHGGGHFDRLLARVRRGAVVVGIALDEQVVATVPTAGHDHPVSVLVTPTRTIRPAGST